jgi:DNA recombination protein RmuC
MAAFFEFVASGFQSSLPWLRLALPYLLVAIAVAMLATLIWQRRVRLQLQQQLLQAQQALQQLDSEQRQLYQGVARGEEAIKQLDRQEELNFHLQQLLDNARDALAQVRSEKSALLATLEQERLRGREHVQILQQAREDLGQEFENLANRIFDDKSERFRAMSASNLDQTLTPLRLQLREFKSRVEDVYDRETRDRVSLVHQIGELQALNRQISEDAVKLTNALKGDNKAQGTWGEVVLERLLEQSGLRKGHEYETQVALKSESGRRRNPDIIVRLPDGRDIVIDAKVSLLDYERYYGASLEEDKQQYLRGHVASIKNHIQGLSVKAYEELEGIRTLDFVLIFIPIETAFMLAFEHEPDLFTHAYDKNVIVVGPTTLLATLRTIQSIWRYERQNRNAEEIAQQAGRIHDQVVRVTESLEELGKHLGKAQDSWHRTNERLRTGRGNLLVMADKLEQLGAKTRKHLPRDNAAAVED